jgi:hypothetical protein
VCPGFSDGAVETGLDLVQVGLSGVASVRGFPDVSEIARVAGGGGARVEAVEPPLGFAEFFGVCHVVT